MSHSRRISVVLLALVGLGGVTFAACGDDDGGVVAGTPADTPSGARAGTPAPRADGTEAMYLSQQQFGTQGGTLAFAVHNAGAVEELYGVDGSIERWTGAQWETHLRFGSSLRFWHTLGTAVPPGTELAVPSIGLLAAPSGFGPVEWLTVPPLEPGWYRLVRTTNDDHAVSGRFEIVDDAVGQIDFADPVSPALELNPAVVTLGTSAFRVTVTHPSIGTAEEHDAYRAGLAGGGMLEQWDGAAWTAVGPVTFVAEPSEFGGFDEIVTLPADLGLGVYRVTRSHSDGTTLGGALFVAAGPFAG